MQIIAITTSYNKLSSQHLAWVICDINRWAIQTLAQRCNNGGGGGGAVGILFPILICLQAGCVVECHLTAPDWMLHRQAVWYSVTSLLQIGCCTGRLCGTVSPHCSRSDAAQAGCVVQCHLTAPDRMLHRQAVWYSVTSLLQIGCCTGRLCGTVSPHCSRSDAATCTAMFRG